jgi:hypothetical protein
VASSIPTYHLHLHYIHFLDFSLSYSPELPHHSPSTMIICHISSLEFSFAFTIYKVKHRYLLRVNHHKNISREEKSDRKDSDRPSVSGVPDDIPLPTRDGAIDLEHSDLAMAIPGSLRSVVA